MKFWIYRFNIIIVSFIMSCVFDRNEITFLILRKHT